MNLVADKLPPPPQELADQEEPFNEKPLATETKLLEPAGRPVEAAGKTASEVIETSALEESVIGETGIPKENGPIFADAKTGTAPEIGPSLVGEIEVPRQPVKEKPAAPVPQAKSPPAPLTVPLTSVMADKVSKLTLLPDWLRHLPETVATSIVASDPDAADPDPDPDSATDSTPEPTPQATPLLVAKAQHMPQSNGNDLWREPETLIVSLRELNGNGAAGKWAAAVLQQIRALGPAIIGGSDEATAILDRLAELYRQALAAKLPDRASARRWQEVGYALGRRIDIWRQVVLVGKAGTANANSPALDSKKLADCLAEIEAATGKSPDGQAWREFLLIDALKEHCAKQPLPDERLSRETAQRALVRLTRTPLTHEQQRFISSTPVAALRVELWHWAAEPIRVAELLRDIERYEWTCLPNDARRLAVDYQSLLASPVEARRQLAERFNDHYRNANFRFAVTEELLNDLIPEQKMEYAQVHETVLSHPVQGESLMATELAVRMLPDPEHARLMLEVTGEMAALTTTDAGLAQFHNESESRYVGRKPLEIDMKGISVWPVEVYVQNETRLNGVQTSIDNVPLFNWLAKMAARQQHDMNLPAATEEMRQKIEAKASERIDAEVRQRLSEVVERLNQRLFDPLNSLALDPQLIEAKTDEERFTMRLRLGGEDQLGSHTPRPQAQSDSLASMQIHESVINNGIQRLQLDGRKFTVPELSRHVAASLNCPAPWPTNPDNDDVKITFADRNAVVVHCQDGRLMLTLSIARLSKSPHMWRNFQIRAFYKPEVHGRSAELVRDGVIQLIGPRNMGSQLALRGIFSHALSKKAPWELIPEKIVNQPRLQNAAITQFDIIDGWIGISLGQKPQTAARRQRLSVR